MKNSFSFLLVSMILVASCTNHRTQPTTFSWDDLKKMVVQNGFWDSYRNPGGKAVLQKLVVSPDSLVVHDKKNGLFWQRGSSDLIECEEAQAYVDGLNTAGFGGYSDWRIPTIEDLYYLLVDTINPEDRLFMNPVFDNSKIVVRDVFPNQAWLLSCDAVIMTLLDKTPIGEMPLFLDFGSGMSCGGGAKRAVRAVR